MNADVLPALSLEELDSFFPDLTFHEVLKKGDSFLSCLATYSSLERRVVVHLYLGGDAGKGELKEAFIAEAGRLLRLKHPNLVQVLDFGSVKEFLYLTTNEWPGQSLAEVAGGEQVGAVAAVRLVRSLLAGLQKGHESGLIHGHLNPHLVFLNGDEGEVQVKGFGLTIAALKNGGKAIDDTASAYAAPQALIGKTDARSDVYSAAVVLYELVTGRLLAQPYKAPSAVAACDVRFDAIMRKAFHPSPAKRYQSAAELALDLEQVDWAAVATAPNEDGHYSYPVENPVKVSPSASEYGAVRARKSKAVATALIGGAGVSILLGAGMIALKSGETSEPVRASNTPQPVAAGLLVEDSFLFDGQGGYRVGGSLLAAQSQGTGFSGQWMRAANWVRSKEASIGTNSLNYRDPAYRAARGGRVVVRNLGEGIVYRHFRMLPQAYNEQSATTVYLSFLMETVADSGEVYRALELSDGAVLNKKEKHAFQLGFSNGAFRSNNQHWGFSIPSHKMWKRLGKNSAKATLFVVKFDLVPTEKGDVVTVWKNPTLTKGNDPQGGVTVSGLDLSFDRLSLAQFGPLKKTSWDEIRMGLSFSDVTTGE